MARNVTKKNQTDIDTFLPDDGDRASDDFEREDLMIPRLTILQELSPQVKKRDPDYVEGAEAGMIFNPITQEILESIEIVVIAFRRAYIEWVTRSNGGGFVADHGSDPSCLDKCSLGPNGERLTPEGNEIVQTSEYYVYYLDADGNPNEALISMAKSQLKYSRRFNSLMSKLRVKNSKGEMVEPPRYYQTYLLSVKPDQNKKGDTFYSWQIDVGTPLPELKNGTELFNAAREFNQRIKDGKIRVQPPQEESFGEDDSGMGA